MFSYERGTRVRLHRLPDPRTGYSHMAHGSEFSVFVSQKVFDLCEMTVYSRFAQVNSRKDPSSYYLD